MATQPTCQDSNIRDDEKNATQSNVPEPEAKQPDVESSESLDSALLEGPTENVPTESEHYRAETERLKQEQRQMIDEQAAMHHRIQQEQQQFRDKLQRLMQENQTYKHTIKQQQDDKDSLAKQLKIITEQLTKLGHSSRHSQPSNDQQQQPRNQQQQQSPKDQQQPRFPPPIPQSQRIRPPILPHFQNSELQDDYSSVHYGPYYQPDPESKYSYLDELVDEHYNDDTMENIFTKIRNWDPEKDEIQKAKELATEIANIEHGDKNFVNAQAWDRTWKRQLIDLRKKLATKSKDKLPTCDLRFHGDPSKDKGMRLSEITKVFIDWVKINELPKKKWLLVWTTHILQGNARKLYYQRRDEVDEQLPNLLNLLQTAFRQEHQLPEKLANLKQFNVITKKVL